MLVKSLINTKVQTVQWKKEVGIWEIFDCSPSVYTSLKIMYRTSFEFLPLYIISLSNQEVKGILYKEWEVVEVEYKDFNLYKSFYIKSFIFVDTAELYEKYILDTENTVKIEETEDIVEDIVEKNVVNTEITQKIAIPLKAQKALEKLKRVKKK